MVGFFLNPDRGGIPQWSNRFAVLSWPEWLAFDPISAAPKITVPTLLVHSEQATDPQGAHRFLDRLSGPKTELLSQGLPGLPVDVQGLGLASAAVQGDHELASEPLPQRVGGHQGLQLADQLEMAAEHQVCLEPLLQRGQSLLLEAGQHTLIGELRGYVTQDRPTP